MRPLIEYADLIVSTELTTYTFGSVESYKRCMNRLSQQGRSVVIEDIKITPRIVSIAPMRIGDFDLEGLNIKRDGEYSIELTVKTTKTVKDRYN